ncbi:MAG: hypothetical protein K0R65_1701 [Crocinitomicaceae bacterium]|jgi:hypothetical protein|nr:hypothetical protein [Crocinitomicaceae bacterium]
MKNFFYTSLLILGAFFLFSCGGGENGEDEVIEDEELYEFKGFSLKEYDIPATIMLPDETANIGASTTPEIIHAEDDFKWELIVGPNFHMIIDDWGDDREMVSAEKKRLEGLNFYKIKYIENKPDFIFYERILKVEGEKSAPKSVGLEHKSYHVYGQKVIDGITYVFRSRDEGFEKVIIDFMAKSIKSVKPVKKSA